MADLTRSRSPRQIAGRLRAEAADETLGPCTGHRSGRVEES
ncbi:hypothetical protein [Arachnia propionica]|nr:hypothetical protein [Arachnia propionica]